MPDLSSRSRQYETPLPIIACQINRYWKEITIQFPDVWSHINIPISATKFNPASFLLLCSNRSKSCLLDIIIDIGHYNLSEPDLLDLSKVVLLSVQLADRLRCLVITSNGWSSDLERVTIGPLLGLVSAPYLQDLELTMKLPHQLPTPTSTASQNIMGDAPCLRSVRIQGVSSSPRLLGLTTLDIHTWLPGYGDISDLAISSPALTSLILRNVCRTSISITTSVFPVSFLFLRFLAVTFSSAHRDKLAPYHHATALLSTPNLECLELGGPYIPDLSICFAKSTLNKVHTLRLRGLSREILPSDVSLLQSLSRHTSAADSYTWDTRHTYSQPDEIKAGIVYQYS